MYQQGYKQAICRMFKNMYNFSLLNPNSMHYFLKLCDNPNVLTLYYNFLSKENNKKLVNERENFNIIFRCLLFLCI